MKMKAFCILLILPVIFNLCLPVVVAAEIIETGAAKVFYLEPGSIIDYQNSGRYRGIFKTNLRTYCYKGSPKTLLRIFETIDLLIDIEGDEYTQYEGATPDDVQQHHDEQKSLFSLNLFSQKRTRLQLSPFELKCIGIDTFESHRVILQQVRVDFWRVIQLTVGLLLFLYGSHLSHNTVFFYITGVSLGICSSFILLIWFSSKLVPRRTVMYGVVIGGSLFGFYVLQMLWENLQTIVITYRTYVFWYILVTGVISFFFCYRLGPPKNERSKNIIKWVLQMAGIMTTFFSSHFEEATASIIIITLVVYYMPRTFLRKLRSWYSNWFPPKRRLLTNEEYYEQGVRETIKSLNELRTFAKSPECKQWTVMTQLRDPMRFAAFVEGASHLRDEEILRFENFKNEEDDSEATTDEENEEEEPNHNVYNEHQQSARSTNTPNRRDYQVTKKYNVTTARSISESEELDESDMDEIASTKSTYGTPRHTSYSHYTSVSNTPRQFTRSSSRNMHATATTSYYNTPSQTQETQRIGSVTRSRASYSGTKQKYNNNSAIRSYATHEFSDGENE